MAFLMDVSLLFLSPPQCLKFTQKVAFNIASEASYVCILSIKNSLKVPKMVNLGTFWKTEATWKQCYQTGQFQKGKNWWKGPKLKNWQWDILGDFQPLWRGYSLPKERIKPPAKCSSALSKKWYKNTIFCLLTWLLAFKKTATDLSLPHFPSLSTFLWDCWAIGQRHGSSRSFWCALTMSFLTYLEGMWRHEERPRRNGYW